MSELPIRFWNNPLLADTFSPRDSALLSNSRCELLGMPVHALTEKEVLAVLEHRLDRRMGTWVLTPNLDILRQYQAQPEVRRYFHADEGGADLLLADGMPLVWASRLSGKPLPERVPGSGIVWSLAKRAAQKKWRLYLLGGAPGSAVRAAEVLKERYTGLEIAGTCCPEMGFDQDEGRMEALRVVVAAAKPDIVYVALGFPKQEKVIQYLRSAMPKATFIGVGISLSFIAGDVKRAPRWVQKSGLEWVHRLCQEPRRLARRYLVHDAPFALFQLFPRSLAARWAGGSDGDGYYEGRTSPPSSGSRPQTSRPTGPVNPRENEGRADHEGYHPRRRPGHASEPADQGHQQAPAARLRQADDHVPNRLSA